MSSNKYYVYVCKVDGEIKYVGMGSGLRYKHCTSGTSSCAELNRDYFEGKELKVEKLYKKLTKEEAERIEEEMISELFDTLYNKVVRSPKRNKKTSTLSRTKVKVITDSFVDYDKQDLFMDAMDIDQKAFECITETLYTYGKQLYLVQDGSTKSVVIDNVNLRGFSKTDTAHVTCFTYPFCTKENCEIKRMNG